VEDERAQPITDETPNVVDLTGPFGEHTESYDVADYQASPDPGA
jgi:hypothetical protein